MPRKRALGGGRKPKGEFPRKTSAFSTRITAETRRGIDNAASRSGRSVSQEAEHLLRTALQKPAGAAHNRALAHAVALLAGNIEEAAGRKWLADAFTGQAFLHALQVLVRRLIPVVEASPAVPSAIATAAARMPPEFAERFRTPSGLGHMLAHHLLMEIEAAAPAGTASDEWTMPMFFSADQRVLSLVSSDLGLSKGKKGKST